MFCFTFCDSVIMVLFLVYFALGFIAARNPSTYLEPYLDSKACEFWTIHHLYMSVTLFISSEGIYHMWTWQSLPPQVNTHITCLFWYNFHSDQTTTSSSTCSICLVKMCIMMCVLPDLYASKIKVQKKKISWPFLNENFHCHAKTCFLEF